jgi:methylated-DNA-protein-cysteine methyltransferase related protein
MPHVYTDIYKIVQTIPKGRVLTYGLISHMIGGRMSAQGVGWALKALGSAKRTESSVKTTAKATAKKPAEKTTRKTAKKGEEKNDYNSSTVPWHRVVNAQGGTSTHKIPEIPPDLQKELLELEGVVFNDEGKLDLSKYLWLDRPDSDK